MLVSCQQLLQTYQSSLALQIYSTLEMQLDELQELGPLLDDQSISALGSQ